MVVDIFSKIFEPINNALNGALSNIWNNIKNTFTMIKDYIISVFQEAFDFFGNGISKVKNALGSAIDKVKSVFSFGSDNDKEATKETASNAKELTDVATTSNVANNNYKNDVNKTVVQNINVDARNSEKQAGDFVASLTQDTNDYNSYSNNSQTAQF